MWLIGLLAVLALLAGPQRIADGKLFLVALDEFDKVPDDGLSVSSGINHRKCRERNASLRINALQLSMRSPTMARTRSKSVPHGKVRGPIR